MKKFAFYCRYGIFSHSIPRTTAWSGVDKAETAEKSNGTGICCRNGILSHSLLGAMIFLLVCGMFAVRGLAQEAAEGDIEKVTTEGMETSEEKATELALKEAVRIVIKKLVDAEEIENYEKSIEKMLLLNRTFIKDYTTLYSEDDADGIWTVHVEALVKKTELVERLKANGIPVKETEAEKSAARVSLDKGDEAESVRSLSQYFRDEKFPGSLIDIEQEDKVKMVSKKGKGSAGKSSSDNVTVALRFKVRPNIEKYNQFRDGLMEILADISIQKFPVTISMEPMPRNSSTKALYAICPNVMRFHNYIGSGPKPADDENILLMVYQSQSEKLRRTRWIAYELSPEYTSFLSRYNEKIPAAKVTLYDADQKEITSDRFSLNPDCDTTNDPFSAYNFFPYFGINYSSSDQMVQADLSPTSLLDGTAFIAFNTDQKNVPITLYCVGPMSIMSNYHHLGHGMAVFPNINVTANFNMTKDEFAKIDNSVVEVVPDLSAADQEDTESFEEDSDEESEGVEKGAGDENPF